LVTFIFLLHSLLPRGLSSWLKLSSDMCILFCSRDPLQSHTISSPLLSWELSSSLSTFVCLRVTLLPMTFSSGYDTLSTMTRSLKVKSNLFDLIWFTVFNATFSNISNVCNVLCRCKLTSHNIDLLINIPDIVCTFTQLAMCWQVRCTTIKSCFPQVYMTNKQLSFLHVNNTYFNGQYTFLKRDDHVTQW
jgi:hypothetical protein